GAYSQYRGYHRGTDPAGLDPRRFVFCIQNHDRIGNRAHGERLNHQVDLATYRAVSALLLICPCTPLLFMGQEWASSSPFLFFTDHPEALAVKVREGRLQEFRHYRAFSDPEQASGIPDCQAVSTFQACKLDWPEREREPYAGIERFYRAWLEIRAREPALREHNCGSHHAGTLGPDTLFVHRSSHSGERLLFVARLKGSGQAELTEKLLEPTAIFHRKAEGPEKRGLAPGPGALALPKQSVAAGCLSPFSDRQPYENRSSFSSGSWQPVLNTEEEDFTTDPQPPRLENEGRRLTFERPSGILLRFVPPPVSPYP
ncbi:MAG TPA: DUF3459 domain-containing protein, partial [Isosphaeraceae bacterium]|nr:DUF3459 domain-containing protein [Isosphaeraceae bacterium]